jgi:hypothetical protein
MARTTDNLKLTIPDAGEPAEQWVQEISDTFEAIDRHDHTTGKKITQEALDLRGPVTLQGHPLNATSSVQLQPQASPPLGSGRLYVDGAGNLYFRTAADIPVQITSAVGVAGSGGSIGGDYAASGASLTYDSAAKTYRLLDQNGALAAVIAANAAVTQLSLGDTSPSAMRTLATVGGELYYRDASNRTYPLTNNGHVAGGDIRGSYQISNATLSYDSTNKSYNFLDQNAAWATISAGVINSPSYLLRARTVRRLSKSPGLCLVWSGTLAPATAWGNAQDVYLPQAVSIACTLPVLRSPNDDVVLTALGVDYVTPTGSGTNSALGVVYNYHDGGASSNWVQGSATTVASGGNITTKSATMYAALYRDALLTINLTHTSGGTNNDAGINVRRIWAEYETQRADAWSS